MPTDRGGVDQIESRAEEGGDQTEDFWRETVDGGETVLEISRRDPNRMGSSRYLVNLEVPKVGSFARGSGGVTSYLILSQTKCVVARYEFERVNRSRSVLAALSTRIGHTLSEASSVDPAFPPEHEVAGV